MEDSRFMSANDKEKALKQWEAFLKSGCDRSKFTAPLYEHLIQHCSFIAHYDRDGFYDTYFTSGEMVGQFLSQFDQRKAGANGIPPNIEYGDTWWVEGDCGDINREMIRIAGKYIPSLLVEAQESQRQADIQQATALLAKHNITLP